MIAALLYAVFAGPSAGALAVEAGGVLIYGAPAALGLRGLGGWLLHPLWDLGLGADGIAPD